MQGDFILTDPQPGCEQAWYADMEGDCSQDMRPPDSTEPGRVRDPFRNVQSP